MSVASGQRAPDFSLPDQNGKIHTLGQYRGRWVVLYVYPKDDTPGCTREACGMRDSLPEFEKLNAVVLGVSADSVFSHKKFAEKYRLPFPLLADERKVVIKAFGAWGKKQFLGKEYEGIKRTTVVFDPDGKVAKVYGNVKPDGHAEEVLGELAQLSTNL